MKKTIITTLLILGAVGLCAQNKPKPERAKIPAVTVDPATLLPLAAHPNRVAGAIYADPSRDAAERANDLLRRMTFEEKLLLTGGWNRFLFNGVERLGIRSVSMADGGQGVRLPTALIRTKSTTMPAMITLASTWNRELAAGYGRSVAEECRALGVDILLGPGANMQRLSVGGRNFEYWGEDPYLSTEMVVAYIKAMQKVGIIAVPKHFLGNDQDFCRHIASSNIDQRTLREIYLPVWEGAFTEAGALGMMTGNNMVNGTPTFMNRPLINDILRSEYGFMGMAMTDWQNSSYHPWRQNEVLVSGESLMMPDNNALRDYVEPEAAKSPQRRAEIETMVEKMAFYSLYSLFKMGVYDRPVSEPKYQDSYDSHRQWCRRVGTEGIVMLKNDKNFLPLNDDKKILLTGKVELHSGGGSGFVVGYDHRSFADELGARFGDKFSCNYAATDAEIKQAGVVLYNLVKETSEGRDVPFEEPRAQLDELRRVLKLNKNVVVMINASNTMPMDWAKDAKAILWCAYLGQERGMALVDVLTGVVSPSGKLPFTIERSFADSPAPEYNYLNGKPYWKGNNGYRSYWIGYEPKTTNDEFSEWVKQGEALNVPYSEGIFVGYRWYDKNKIPVVYPFGAGLSYTEFGYGDLKIENRMDKDSRVVVTFRLTNVGKVDAQEVAQLYVRDVDSQVERPQKELKGFEKVALRAGESRTVSLVLDKRAFSFWDTASDEWKLEPGDFVVSVGGSSQNLPLSSVMTIK